MKFTLVSTALIVLNGCTPQSQAQMGQALRSSVYGDSQVMQCAGMAQMTGKDTNEAIRDCQTSIYARRQTNAQYQQQQNTENRQTELLEKQNRLLEEQNRKLDMIQMNQFESLNKIK